MEYKYIERHVDKELVSWKNDDEKKPLLLRGARQVGKSSAVRKLAEHFDYFIEINFEFQKELVSLFEQSQNPQEICSKLSVIFNTPIEPNKTLLFLDEIQACIPAISSLRFFYEKYPELHVIAAGSLLEFALHELPSFGVGRIRSIFMYPFSFDEFLNAQGEILLVKEKKEANSDKPLIKPFHDKLINYLKTYLIIGGLPEVVRKYVTSKDFLQCQKILQDLIVTYTDDFAKYKKRFSPSLINKVLVAVAKNVGTKFMYSNVSENTKSHQVKEALELLVMAGLVIPITHSSGNGLPLGADTNDKFRKFIMFDTGIQQMLLGLAIGEIFLHDTFEVINKGFIAETFAGLEFIKYQSCYQRSALYYWQREEKSGNAEVDYLVQRQNKVLPVEIKAGTKGSMQSLYYFMDKKKIETAVRSSNENFAKYENVEIVPLYALSNLYTLK